jgi:hypothetical protein
MKLLITATVLAAGALIVEATDYALTQAAEIDCVATFGFRTVYSDSEPASKT